MEGGDSTTEGAVRRMSRPRPGGPSTLEAPAIVGRRHEMAAIRRALSSTRLLTLTGTGGVGKSRLARWTAEALRGTFPDGVETVDLGCLEDGGLLESAVAAALGLREAGPSTLDTLADYLAGHRTLLVLDNCEHLLDPCARLVHGLLRGAPRLRILVTSRQALTVTGERVLWVPPLPVPPREGPARDVARHDAVRLFEQRAARARPGFAVDAANAPAVARLSRRLEGIPLAIELAAARLRTVPLDQLVSELDRHVEVLEESTLPGPPRRRSLRGTLDWSYELCSPAEQRLWSRLSMFAGGAELEAVEAVCGGGEIGREDVVDLLAGLVDKSVLVPETREAVPRYGMMESVRAYGLERLTRDDAEALRPRYLDHHRRLVEANRLDRLAPDQRERYRRLQADLANVRVAIELSLGLLGQPRAGLEMAARLWGYWLLAGSLTEGRHWLGRALSLSPEPSLSRVEGLWVSALLALHQGDLAAAEPPLGECASLARRLGDDAGLACAVQTAGLAAFAAGDAARGLALLEEAHARHEACGERDALALNLFYTAAYGAAAHPERVAEQGERFLALAEAHHAEVSRAYALFAVGLAAWNRGDWRRAEALMRESAAFRGAIGDRWGLAQCLEVLAWIAGARGDHGRAARGLGAVEPLWRAMGASPDRLWPHVQGHERCVAAAREALGERGYAAAFRAGAGLGLERALASAMEEAAA